MWNTHPWRPHLCCDECSRSFSYANFPFFVHETPGNASCIINLRLHRTLLMVSSWSMLLAVLLTGTFHSQPQPVCLRSSNYIVKCYRILCVSSFSSRCGDLAMMSVSPASPVGLAHCCHFNPLIALRKPADFQCIRLFSLGKDESDDLQASSTSVL